MKNLLTSFILAIAAACVAAPQTTTTGPQAVEEDYGKVVESLLTREAISDCIIRLDSLIDEGEHGVVDDQPHPGMVETVTRQGLHFEFSASIIGKEAIIYYLTVSRSGKDFKYSEATQFAALFADRAGLPHPITITEGEKPIFYAQWLIKRSTRKAMRKMMVKTRAAYRAEKDPLRAFTAAVNHELEARAATAIRNR
jgi:hypothetical protein